MQRRERTTIDKSTWGEGEWQNEPDKIQWRDPATGLPCLIVRSSLSGALCGYVGVFPGHPYHDKGYSVLFASAESCIKTEPEVHGGVTFIGGYDSGPFEYGLCHVLDASEHHNVWWVGFDCAHCEDIAPGLEAMRRTCATKESEKLDEDYKRLLAQMPDSFLPPTYKTIAYVQAECANLARQLAGIIERCAAPSL